MTGSANTRRGVRELSGIVPGELHELGKALEGGCCWHDQEIWNVGDVADGRQLPSGVIWQAAACNRIEWNGQASQQHGVAIRSRLCNCRCPGNRKSTSLVLNDDR